ARSISMGYHAVLLPRAQRIPPRSLPQSPPLCRQRSAAPELTVFILYARLLVENLSAGFVKSISPALLRPWSVTWTTWSGWHYMACAISRWWVKWLRRQRLSLHGSAPFFPASRLL